MSQKFWDKVLQFIGLQETEVAATEEAIAPKATIDNGKPEQPSTPKKRGQLISLNNRTSPMRVIVLAPREYDEVAGISEHLKAGRPILIKVDDITRSLARRIIDFVSGSTYALDGSIQRIAESIFLFCPPNVDVDMDEATAAYAQWIEADDFESDDLYDTE